VVTLEAGALLPRRIECTAV